jgi:hypothetical protein
MTKRTILLLAGMLILWSAATTVKADLLPPSSLDLAMKMEMASAGDEFDNEATPDRKNVTSETISGKKSLAKAAIYSALLPGLGELYVGHKQKARIFFGVEAVTWIGYASYRIYGHAKEEDYIRFAQTNANAQLDGKNDEFRDMVGFYTSINEYNSFGRVFDPDRPYLVDSPENHWQWQTEEDQATYRHLKNRSREAYRKADFFVGIAIIARVVSVIDVVRDVKRYNSRLDREMAESPFKLQVNPFSSTRQVVLSMRTPF